MALLEVEGLVKYFGRRKVVDGVAFDVSPGEVVGLLGPNGAGKTTSFRMATGQIAPNAGRVTFNNEDVTSLAMYQRARRGMGYLSQEPSVFRKLTVEQNLMAILEALPRSRSLDRRLTREERHERTDEALRRFKLDHVRHNVAARCSGGEKRRLEIARCLVCEPLLILLDEPFAAVDPKTTEDIRHNIRELANSGIGILITDHNVREVFRSADRVYLITEGKVVTHGTPHDLVNDQIAIDAYLGRSFEEDGFTRHFARKASSAEGGTAVMEAPPMVTAPPRPGVSRLVETPPPAILSFSSPPSTAFSFGGSVGQLLDREKIHRNIEMLLKGDEPQIKAATVELVQRGSSAVPVLLESLERREVMLRRRAFEVLKFIVLKSGQARPLDFDPDGPDDVRLRQVAYLRVRLER